MYKIADAAVVGGTFVDIGGHNVWEPARFGIPVFFGPYHQSQSSSCEKLLAAGIQKAGSIEAAKLRPAMETVAIDSIKGHVAMRACDHQTLQPLIISEIQAKSDFYPFPFLGKPGMIPAERIAIPPNETGNPRCK
jgi:hypothetical protein